jgi:hypothetical protein
MLTVKDVYCIIKLLTAQLSETGAVAYLKHAIKKVNVNSQTVTSNIQ